MDQNNGRLRACPARAVDSHAVDTAARLRAAGLRVTESRRAVVDALVERPHASADELFGIVARTRARHEPAVGVQRARRLRRRRARAPHRARGPPGLFELRVDDNHHHLICSECGAVQDVDCVVGDAPCLTPSDAHGYALQAAEVTFWGVCPACATPGRAPPSRSPPPAPDILSDPLIAHPDWKEAMTDTNDTIPEIGENPTDADQAVTPIDTPVDEREDGETRPRPNESESCPVIHGGQPHPTTGNANSVWWPNQLNLKILAKNPAVANPLGEDFDYKAAFEALDLAAVKADIAETLTTSQDWWPADFGNYGPLMIRMAWHSAGTYRVTDGRGGGGAGQQRFAPLNSWPDNVNLDKARRLLWPVKKKYGQSLSWADLMILAGNVALESMGFKTFGYAGGRPDVWEPDADVYWGPETTWLDDERYSGDRELEKPLAAVQMGLIYVNPEGPNGNPDPLASARDIRETFGRMAMDDEETVALIAGGHTFGKTHGAAPDTNIEDNPEAAGLEQQGLGWKNNHGTGQRRRHHHVGPRGDVDVPPHALGQRVLPHPLRVRVGAHAQPGRRPPVAPDQRRRRRHGAAGALERPSRAAHADERPGAAHRSRVRRHLAPLQGRPRGVRRRVRPRLVQADAPRHGSDRPLPRTRGAGRGAALAGPRSRRRPRTDRRRRRRGAQGADPRVGPHRLGARRDDVGCGILVPRQRQARRRQRRPHPPGAAEGLGGQQARLSCRRCWRSSSRSRPRSTTAAPTARGCRWPTSSCSPATRRSRRLRRMRASRPRWSSTRAAPTPRRSRPTRSRSRSSSRSPTGSATTTGRGAFMPEEHHLIDRANLLTLSAPELTVLVGGLRVLGANWDDSDYGVFTDRKGVLTNDFFVNLLDLGTTWKPLDPGAHAFSGAKDGSGEPVGIGTRVDLLFGSNSELRAVAEVYASDDANEKFVRDFVKAWGKVTELDRFDLV